MAQRSLSLGDDADLATAVKDVLASYQQSRWPTRSLDPARRARWAEATAVASTLPRRSRAQCLNEFRASLDDPIRFLQTGLEWRAKALQPQPKPRRKRRKVGRIWPDFDAVPVAS